MTECHCGDDIDPRRYALGYRVCLPCGEANARQARKSWTVVQEYTKGNYQLVTSSAAYVTLRQTNPKENRV
jgi:hypothetical protein